MNPFEMVVLIVAISAVASIFRAKYGVTRRRKGSDDEHVVNDAENDRLRQEVRALKDRVAVLERIATENDRGLQLDREIEALRHRD